MKETPKFKQIAAGTGQYGSLIVALGEDGIVYQWNRPGPLDKTGGRWSPLLNRDDPTNNG